MKAIYTIEHVATGRKYVGSAANLNNRWAAHKCLLKQGKHHSKALQRAWNKYGSAAFAFVCIEELDNSTDLLTREQYWIDTYNSYKQGFNCCPSAYNTAGRKLSVDARKRISLARRKLTDEEEQQICQRYVNGEYSTILAKEYGLSGARSLCDLLERHGVPRRSRGQQKGKPGTSRTGVKHTKRKST